MAKVSTLYIYGILSVNVSLARRTYISLQLCLNVLNRGRINNNIARLVTPAIVANSSGIILSEKKWQIDRIDEIILSDIACDLMTIADEEELLLDLVDTAIFLLVLLLEEVVVVVVETTCKRCRDCLLANPDKPNILIV